MGKGGSETDNIPKRDNRPYEGGVEVDEMGPSPQTQDTKSQRPVVKPREQESTVWGLTNGKRGFGFLNRYGASPIEQNARNRTGLTRTLSDW